MPERDFNSEFIDLAVHYVADDERLKRVLRYILLGDIEDGLTDQSPDYDFAEVNELLRLKYGLTDEQLGRAYTICEQNIETELFHG